MEEKKLNLKKIKIAKLSTSAMSPEGLKIVKGGGDFCAFSVVTIETIGGTPTTMAPSITSCCVTAPNADENTCNTRSS